MSNVGMLRLLYPDESDLGASSLSMPSHLDSTETNVCRLCLPYISAWSLNIEVSLHFSTVEIWCVIYVIEETLFMIVFEETENINLDVLG